MESMYTIYRLGKHHNALAGDNIFIRIGGHFEHLRRIGGLLYPDMRKPAFDHLRHYRFSAGFGCQNQQPVGLGWQFADRIIAFDAVDILRVGIYSEQLKSFFAKAVGYASAERLWIARKPDHSNVFAGHKIIDLFFANHNNSVE